MSPRRAPDIEWAKHAACVGSTIHFPVHNPRWRRQQQTAAAKEVCYTCPVRLQCLKHALDNQEPDGVWGGYLFPNGVRAAARRNRLEAG